MEDYAKSKAMLFGMSENSLIMQIRIFRFDGFKWKKVYSYGIEKIVTTEYQVWDAC